MAERNVVSAYVTFRARYVMLCYVCSVNRPLRYIAVMGSCTNAQGRKYCIGQEVLLQCS